jgi:glycosyltransferase involved in cell wall biosynthesis
MSGKLLVITPYITSYRIHFFAELSKYYKLHIISTQPSSVDGFGNTDVSKILFQSNNYVSTYNIFRKKIIYQSGIFRIIREISPDVIFVTISFRDLSFWILLLYAKIARIRVYTHGMGPFYKRKSFVEYMKYLIVINFSEKIVGYNKLSVSSLNHLGFRSEKICYINNVVNNAFKINYLNKNPRSRGILFLGRIRNGCNLDLLINTFIMLQEYHLDLELHIVGDGVNKRNLCDRYYGVKNIFWYGAIHDQKRISDISKKCTVGCYPGSAGLSVIHYLSLSLPVITHNNLSKHQGPEPFYLKDNFNSLLFDYFRPNDSLYGKLFSLFNDVELISLLQKNAFLTYEELINPSMAQNLISIIEGDNPNCYNEKDTSN